MLEYKIFVDKNGVRHFPEPSLELSLTGLIVVNDHEDFKQHWIIGYLPKMTLAHIRSGDIFHSCGMDFKIKRVQDKYVYATWLL